MTVVVTGASGHLGGNLVRALLDRGRKVRVLVHRDRTALGELHLETCEGDVTDPASLRRAFRGAEVVYHAAAHISIVHDEWPALEAVNIEGTRNVVAAAQECGVRRLVHFSSVHALQQEPLDEPLDESRPLVSSPDYSPYDRSKAAGERRVRRAIEQGLDAIILYPTGIIGPYDWRPSHFGAVLVSLCRQQIPALVAGGFDWVDARDVAAGAIQAEQVAASGSRYLLSGHWLPMDEIAALVQEILNVPIPRWTCPMWLARLAAPAACAYVRGHGRRPLFTPEALHALGGNRQISHVLAERELGYHLRPFRETLADTLRWFQEVGFLPSAARPTEGR